MRVGGCRPACGLTRMAIGSATGATSACSSDRRRPNRWRVARARGSHVRPTDVAAMNTFVFLQKAAMQRPDQPALVHGSESISYREFHDRALAIGGNLLALGLTSGDRVAFCLANSPRILEIIYGCFAAGLVVVPINARLHPREIAYIVSNSGARVLIHGPEYQEGITQHLAEFAGLEHRICTEAVDGAVTFRSFLNATSALAQSTEVSVTDSCLLFYPSRTSGKPHVAISTHLTVRVVSVRYLY